MVVVVSHPVAAAVEGRDGTGRAGFLWGMVAVNRPRIHQNCGGIRTLTLLLHGGGKWKEGGGLRGRRKKRGGRDRIVVGKVWGTARGREGRGMLS